MPFKIFDANTAWISAVGICVHVVVGGATTDTERLYHSTVARIDVVPEAVTSETAAPVTSPCAPVVMAMVSVPTAFETPACTLVRPVEDENPATIGDKATLSFVNLYVVW